MPLRPNLTSRLVQFSDFVADLDAGELRKAGIRLSLPDQAFQVLATLLENRGHVVARGELKSKLWENDTFVDFEHCLNVSVNKLRDVLGDSPRQPRFIETVRGQGYRFVAAVTSLPPEIEHPEAIQTPEVPPTVSSRAKPPAVRGRLYLLLLVPVLGLGLWVLVRGTRPIELPNVRAITNFAGSKDFAALSPDGQRIAFAWVGPADQRISFSSGRRRRIYTKVVGGGEPVALTNYGYDESYPAWSPGGRYIAFIRNIGSSISAYIIPSAGGSERKICDVGGPVSWSPDGRLLAIASVRDAADRSHIELRSLETDDVRRLTKLDTADSFPVFSPDGRTIAFVRYFSSSAQEIMTIPISGGEPRRLTFDHRAIAGLTWTRDGSGIVFSSNREGGEQLWRVPAAGGMPVKLGFISQNAIYPSAALRSGRIAYTQVYVDDNLYLYQAEGAERPGKDGHNEPGRNRFGAPRALARSTHAEHSPQFSPDHQRIAFVSNRTGSDEIWVVRPDGSDLAQLTNFDGSATGSPRWSPDSRWIAFDSRAAGSGDIWLVRPDGSGLHALTTGPADEVLPVWSRDGAFIYYRVRQGKTGQFFKQRVDGKGAPIQITQGGAFEGWESPDGKLLYFTRAFADYGIWSVPSNGGPEQAVPGLSEVGHYRSWGVMPQGIYFAIAGPGLGSTIKFYDFATRRVTPLMTTEKEPLWLFPGLAMSSDGRSILVSQLDQAVNDLMLIDHFH